MIFLGDYIYEYVERARPTVRRHSDDVEAATLPTYRNRYAQYRLDPDLQRLHAEVPALVTWDDHEVRDDYADRWSPSFDDPEVFLARRAAAYQAFYEHMPLRPSRSRPQGPALRLYDRHALRGPRGVLGPRRTAVQIPRSMRPGAELRRRPLRDRRLVSGAAGSRPVDPRGRPGGVAVRRSGPLPARWNVLAQDVTDGAAPASGCRC